MSTKPKDVDIYEGNHAVWHVVEEDNTMYICHSEEEACAFQRGYRVAKGCDPMTGEPLGTEDRTPTYEELAKLIRELDSFNQLDVDPCNHPELIEVRTRGRDIVARLPKEPS